MYNASLPATVFPLSRGITNAGQQVFENAVARPAAINHNIPLLIPIEVAGNDAAYPVDAIIAEAANMVQPILLPINERQRMAEACREAAQARMRVMREIENDLATERRIPAIRVLAAGNAIFPVQANVPLQEGPIAPRRIVDGDAAFMQVNVNENAVDLRNAERGDVAPQIRFVVRGAIHGRRGRAIAPGQPLIPVPANTPLQERPIAQRRIVDGDAAAVQLNVADNAVNPRNGEEGAVPRLRGRPPGTTALVMAARRAGIPDIPPNAPPRLRQVVRFPPRLGDDLPVYIPMDEGPDQDGRFTHDHIRAIINNRAARFAAEDNVAVLAPEDQGNDLPADEPEEDGEIMANVSCCICQTRRSNLSSKCGHLYCSTCYSTYWKLKLANWNRILLLLIYCI